MGETDARLAPGDPGAPAKADKVVGESRLPMAGAVAAAALLTLLLPDRLTLGPAWLLPSAEGLLLVALVVGDPGRITRRTTILRALSITLVVVLALSALWDTGRLVRELIIGGPATNNASELLSTGGVVWICNMIAFALLYWELDGGGAAARAHRLKSQPDFGFPQQTNPGVSVSDWRPRFGDYLYIGITNSVAFSPTDTMPLALWAKALMAMQAAISFALVGLVLARAVNVFK